MQTLYIPSRSIADNEYSIHWNLSIKDTLKDSSL